jgi:glycosyltransferase involved in cell wall biosynthesis
MPYKILLEGCQLRLSEGTGIATYGRNLVEAIRANGWDVAALIDTDKPLRESDPVLNAISLFDAVKPISWSQIERRLRRAFGAPFGIKATKVQPNGVVADFLADKLSVFDGVWAATDLDQLARHHFARHGKRATVKLAETPSLFHTTQPIAIAVNGCPNIYTIHDLVPLKLPHTTRDQKPYALNMLRELCRAADHIVTVSEFSRREIIKFFAIGEDRVTNTYQAANLPVSAQSWTADQIAKLLENMFGLVPDEYFLFVGAIEPKKNLARLIDAYAASGSQYPLIIAGGLGWQYEQELETIADERFLRYDIAGHAMTPRRRIRRLSYVSSEHLVALMRGARALLFPSLYEGFGLPVLEAMSLGTPVMTSKVASLPEVAGDAALLVDPLDIDAIARAIRSLDHDADLRGELKQRGLKRAEFFSPENYRQRVAELYARVIG